MQLYNMSTVQSNKSNCICTNQNLSLKMTHKIPGDLEIQTDHLILVRKSDAVNKKKNCIRVDFA